MRQGLIFVFALALVTFGFLAIARQDWAATYYMAVPVCVMGAAFFIDLEIAIVLTLLATIVGLGAAMALRAEMTAFWILAELAAAWLAMSGCSYLARRRRRETWELTQALDTTDRTLSELHREMASYKARLSKVREQTEVRTRLARGVGLIGQSLKSADIEQGLKKAVDLIFPETQVDISWLSDNEHVSFDPFELWVRDSRRPLVVSDVSKDERFREYFVTGGLVTSFRSLALFPFGQGPGREPLGLLKVAATTPGVFHADNLRVLDLYALLVGLAFENASLHQAVEHMAVRDALTGVFTRKMFDERLAQESSQASRYRLLLSLALLDIDHFKSFNDRFGHPVGDQLLIWISGILKESIREVDFLARYGGEEFVLLFPETAKSESAAIMETMRRRIESGRFRLESGQNLQVTVSIGVASFPDETKTSRQLIEAADERLYMAKGMGRNRVIAQ